MHHVEVLLAYAQVICGLLGSMGECSPPVYVITFITNLLIFFLNVVRFLVHLVYWLAICFYYVWAFGMVF